MVVLHRAMCQSKDDRGRSHRLSQRCVATFFPPICDDELGRATTAAAGQRDPARRVTAARHNGVKRLCVRRRHQRAALPFRTAALFPGRAADAGA